MQAKLLPTPANHQPALQATPNSRLPISSLHARPRPTSSLPISIQAPSSLFFLQVFLRYLFSAKSGGLRTWVFPRSAFNQAFSPPNHSSQTRLSPEPQPTSSP